MDTYESSHDGAGARERVAAPAVIHVAARPGAWAWAVGSFIGALAFAITLIVGVAIGVITALGIETGGMDDFIIENRYRPETAGPDRLAILPIEGPIDAAQSAFVREAVDHILQDSTFKAVVLRVDSPGGGVTPSDQIWHEITRLREKGLPVIASYGSVAASGGYYVSCGADYIMAEETTITGSIGVIAQVFTMHGLLGKVGIEPVTLVATGSPEKDTANDIFRAWDERDRERVMNVLDSAYSTFRARVADGRGKTIADPQRLATLADGSIFTAKQARDAGLIDGIGYLDDAIAEAERTAKLATGAANVVTLRQPIPLFGNGLLLQGRERIVSPAWDDADSLRSLINDLASPRLMYLMP